jgi:transcription elongation factor Elf1
MDRRQPDKPRCIAVGTTTASCTRCGGEHFIPAYRRQHTRTGTLFCAACGEEHYYTALLRQIAGKVIRRSDTLLEESARLRAKLDELLRNAIPPL